MTERYTSGWYDPRKLYGTIAPEPPPPPLWKQALSAATYYTIWLAGFMGGTLLIGAAGTFFHAPEPLIAVVGFAFGVWYVLR